MEFEFSTKTAGWALLGVGAVGAVAAMAPAGALTGMAPHPLMNSSLLGVGSALVGGLGAAAAAGAFGKRG